MEKKLTNATVVVPRSSSRISRWSLALNALLLLALSYIFQHPELLQNTSNTPRDPSAQSRPQSPSCRSPLPPLLVRSPPAADHPELTEAFRKLDAALESSYNQGASDSISIAVVTSNGSLYEGFWGPLRANETDEAARGNVDRNSIYRVASVSKMFTALETLILRNRGVLNLDDPVDKLLSLTYHTNYGPITFRQLMSHMSGLNTLSPPGDVSGSWPKSLEGESSSDHATLEQTLDSIASHRPIAPPYTFPVYSNTGFKLLGMANVAANRAFENHTDAPSTHAELMHRDVFTPLGLSDSSFSTSPTNRENVVVASIQPGDIDDDHGDASNPSGGQLSSVSDLVKMMQTLIDPSRPESVIPAITVREWLRPLHSWVDDYTAVGAPWEIIKPKDSYGRTQPLYQKLGEMPGYHSGFIINPTSSYGIIILSTGPMTHTIPLTNLIFEHVQPAFDAIMEAEAHKSLVGSWLSDDGQDNIAIDIEAGSLYVTRYMLNDTDVLAVMHNHIGSGKLFLWPTSENEYRLAVPSPYGDCFFSWITLDIYGYINGTSVNVLEFTESEDGVTLYLPAMDMKFKRTIDSNPQLSA